MLRIALVFITLLALVGGCSYFSPKLPDAEQTTDTGVPGDSPASGEEEGGTTEDDLQELQKALEELDVEELEEEPEVDFPADFEAN